MRDTFKAITENTSFSFGVIMVVGGSLVAGYNMMLNVKFQGELNAIALEKLDGRVSQTEKQLIAQQSMATDIAVIKSKVEDIQKNLPSRKN